MCPLNSRLKPPCHLTLNSTALSNSNVILKFTNSVWKYFAAFAILDKFYILITMQKKKMKILMEKQWDKHTNKILTCKSMYASFFGIQNRKWATIIVPPLTQN